MPIATKRRERVPVAQRVVQPLDRFREDVGGLVLGKPLRVQARGEREERNGGERGPDPGDNPFEFLACSERQASASTPPYAATRANSEIVFSTESDQMTASPVQTAKAAKEAGDRPRGACPPGPVASNPPLRRRARSARPPARRRSAVTTGSYPPPCNARYKTSANGSRKANTRAPVLASPRWFRGRAGKSGLTRVSMQGCGA